jgi:tetratricopeptide (TPR) repeat protein
VTPLEQAAGLERAGRLVEAAACLRAAARAAPGDARTWSFLGRVLLRLGQWREGAAAYEAALRLAPGDAESLANYGVALAEMGALERAVDAYARALAVEPNHAIAHYNLGNALRELRRFGDAIASYARALRLQPDWPEANTNLGLALASVGRVDDALAAYGRTLAVRPDHALAHNGAGLALQARGDFASAAACFDRAIALAPEFAQARANRAQLALLYGDFERGWPEYEWRLRVPGHAIARTAAPRWDGAPVSGRTVLLRAEQGFGDTVQLVRLAPVLAARGARVVVETQASIERIVRTCPGIAAVVPRGAPLPPHDLETPIGSVPFRLGLTLDSIPGTVPYLAADPALVADAERRIGRDGQFTVGIAWQGNPVFPQDCHRSMPLRHFAPLAAIPGMRLFSLQKGFGAEQLAAAPFPVEDLGAALDTAGGAFTDTAAAMMALDLVIVSDSAIAHVAGALGHPVWVVLPLAPDWRWLLGREDTPWYPTMRLFRQRRLGEWDEVFERIAAALGAAVTASAGGSPRGRTATRAPAGSTARTPGPSAAGRRTAPGRGRTRARGASRGRGGPRRPPRSR